MWRLKAEFMLTMVFMMGLALSHEVADNGGILANNSLEFRTSPTDEILTVIATEGYVYHMEPDLHIPGNILFTDNYALRTTNGVTVSTIAGSTSSAGNTVAVGQQARFHQLTGFRQISPTHVVVVDYHYHCLRLVDRITLQTPWYAGYCFSRGYSQGTTSARFYHPRSVIMDQKREGMLLVTDRENDAIRHIYPGVGSALRSVTQFYKSSTLDRPFGIVQDPLSGDVYITTNYDKVFKLTYTTRSLTLLAGSSAGFVDGDFGSTKFNDPFELNLIDNGKKLLLSEVSNHRLRILDLITRRTSSLCVGTYGHANGDTSSCTLYQPHSLMVLNNTVYVGEYKKIRKLQDACQAREYDVSPETGLALVEVPRSSGGTTELSLPPGDYPIKVKYSTFNCTILYHVSDNRQIACPQPEIHETTASDTGVAVVDIPMCGSRTGELTLPPGSYPLHITSDDFNCTVQYNVSDYRASQCSYPEIRQSASPDTRVALVDMTLSGLEGQLSLPPGNYSFNTRSNGGCTVDIGVADHRLRRRLVFQAQYDVECEVTEGNVAEAPLTLIVARHAFTYSEICGDDCSRPANTDIRLDCTNHTLTVVWPSNLTYTGDVIRIPAELDQRLTSRIVAKASAFYLFLPELNPPLAFPELEEHGGYMRAMFSSYCVGENVNYVKVTDSCEQQTVTVRPDM